jgi:hypothetical protein
MCRQAGKLAVFASIGESLAQGLLTAELEIKSLSRRMVVAKEPHCEERTIEIVPSTSGTIFL